LLSKLTRDARELIAPVMSGKDQPPPTPDALTGVEAAAERRTLT